MALFTFDDFIKTHDGKPLEVAGSANAKNQCVDLANGYIRDVLGKPIIEWTNAIDFPSKAGTDYQWIANTPTGIPLKGDIMIWGKPVSPYKDSKGNTIYAGHIAVFIEGDANSFKSFDQNWPSNSPCHIQSHNYNNVLGWLRPLNIPGEVVMKNEYKGLDLTNKDSMIVAVDIWYAVVVEKKYVLKEDHDKVVAEKNTALSDLTASQDGRTKDQEEFAKDLKDKDNLILGWKGEYDELMIWLATTLSKPKEEPILKAEIIKLLGLEDGIATVNTKLGKANTTISEKNAELKEIYDYMSVLSGLPVATPAGLPRAIAAHLNSTKSNLSLQDTPTDQLVGELWNRLLKRNKK